MDASNSNSKPQLGYGDYLRFRNLVLEQSGLFFSEKKRHDLEAGIFKALNSSDLTQTNHTTLDNYYNLLQSSTPMAHLELNRLINTLTIGETHFFRNEAQFNALATQVLPALVTRKRAAAAAIGPDIQPQLRIWSAGCASGEEPYSLAILLKELLPDIDQWHIVILATDINDDLLARAQKGHYTDWSFRESRAKALKSKYFSQESSTDTHRKKYYEIQDDVRRMVSFAPLNLTKDTYPALNNNTVSMDLILCRNVTIYFTEQTTRQVVEKFYHALVDGGWLVVGHSEPSLVIYRAFQARNLSNTLLYQKTGQPTPWPDDWEWLNQPDYTAGLSTQQPMVKRPEVTIGRPDSNPGINTASLNKPAINQPLLPGHPAPAKEADPYDVAAVLLNKGHIEEAINELHHKLAAAPNFAPAHSLLGRAYANSGQWAEAHRWCESALKLDALQSEAYYVLALVHEQNGNFDAAIDFFKKAVYLERDNPLFHFNLAVLYKKTDRPQMARRTCQNAIKILQKWPPGSIVPDTGGATAKHLLEAAKRILTELETGNDT